jgi:hypothetical protein
MKYLKYKYGEDLKAFLCNRGVKELMVKQVMVVLEGDDDGGGETSIMK